MGRKTVAELEEENAKLKAKVAEVDSTQLTVLKEENVALKRTAEESAQAQAKLVSDIADMADNQVTIKGGQVVGTEILVLTPDEYATYSKANGRVMGRLKGTKTKPTIEELRALINSNWTPSMVMDKHGIDAEELKQLVWALSTRELRDKPIHYDIARDSFRKDG